MTGVLAIIQQIFFIILVGIGLGYTTFTITSDYMWGIFGGLSITSLILLNKILDKGYYLAFGISFLVSSIIASGFLLFKLKPNSLIKNAIVNTSNNYFDRLKENATGNDSLFFWSMFIATTITIFGLFIAKNVYSKMKKHGGIQGLKGFDGPRGDNGEPSVPLKSINKITYNYLIIEVNKEIEQFMQESPKTYNYISGDDHLKNYFVLENFYRIIYSNDFNKSYIDTLYSNVLKNSNVSNRKCAKENIALKHAIDKLVFDVKKWIRYVLSYKNGLKFLKSEFSNFRDWETLYVRADKMAGLSPNPFDKIKEGIPSLDIYIEDEGINKNKWNWGICNQ